MSGGPIHATCHCKSVELTLSEPPSFQFICHCDSCRKLNGGMQMAGATFQEGALSVHGETSTYRYTGGKAEIEAHFCPRCGTPLFAKPLLYPGAVVVRGNTLDAGLTFSPVKSIYEHQACPWSQIIGSAEAR